jgi:hypothetical protein
MAHTAAIAAAIRYTPQPNMAYTDEPEFSPPPYPHCERQLPPQFFFHQGNETTAAADDPPAYDFYDVERGSLIDVALAQYAQSISPSVASTRYTMLEPDEDDSRLSLDSSGRLKSILFYCVAVFCGITWAAFWVCGIGFAIVISFQKIAERLA